MYIDYYGFSAKPFQLSPDPRFFFGSSGHSRALAYLRYGLSQGEGFIVVTGGIGTGKTTLVKSLFSELDSRQVVAAQLVTTQLEADDLLRTVVASFGLPYEDASKAILLRRFEDFLRGHAEQGRRTLLVVDEAQNLPMRSLEELRMLSNFQVAERPLLQSFLLGQEEFRFTLQDPGMEQLRQRVIASCHLNPLSQDEIGPYIEHRLHIVG
ncbi:MAG: AAA family ATPase, partial [Candidatus Competibacteraceae bacterium]|nr:AAA family ATPase [Candidatus Competibacteraceae bacterium]